MSNSKFPFTSRGPPRATFARWGGYSLFAALPTPPPNRAVLPIRHSIFPFRLVSQNLMVGSRIRTRPPHLSLKQPSEPRLPLEHALMLVVHIENVQLSLLPWPPRKARRQRLQQPPQHRGAKRIEQERHARPIRQPELHRIPANHPYRRPRPSRRPPNRRILSRNPSQRGM
jgi:hypothetical protein